MLAVFKREFRSYFTNMTGYLLIGVLFLFCGIFTTAINLVSGYASFEYVLSQEETVIMFLIPILCMKSIAEDRRSRTDQLLYSLPVSTTKIVLGKYLSLVAIFGIACLGLGVVPFILKSFGPESVSLSTAYASLFGFFLLGAALIAVCMFFSGLTESQVIAAVLGLAASLAFYLMDAIQYLLPTSANGSFVGFLIVALLCGLLLYFLTKNYLVGLGTAVVLFIPLLIVRLAAAEKLEGLFPKVLGYLAIFNRFSSMTGGIFDLTAVVYFLSVAAFFVFLSVQSMEKRRWN